MEISGGCHCGNIRFQLAWPDDEPQISVRECGCSFCRKHGGAWTSNRRAELDVQIEDASLVTMYKFGTATADFYVCSVCGVTPFVVSEIDGRLYGVVNVNAFEDTPGVTFSSSSTDFDGEDVGSRLERRQLNWIPVIRL
jgi:hypothetical protein